MESVRESVRECVREYCAAAPCTSPWCVLCPLALPFHCVCGCYYLFYEKLGPENMDEAGGSEGASEGGSEGASEGASEGEGKVYRFDRELEKMPLVRPDITEDRKIENATPETDFTGHPRSADSASTG